MAEVHSIPTQIHLIHNRLPYRRRLQSLHFDRHRPRRLVEYSVLQQEMIERQP